MKISGYCFLKNETMQPLIELCFFNKVCDKLRIEMILKEILDNFNYVSFLHM